MHVNTLKRTLKALIEYHTFNVRLSTYVVHAFWKKNRKFNAWAEIHAFFHPFKNRIFTY